MSIMQCWQEQQESLQTALHHQTEVAEVIRLVRHSLLQTEQNALAQISDDLLRQQASVLMSYLKSSLGLLETCSAGHVWVARKSSAKPTSSHSPWLYALGICAAMLLWCILKKHWIALILGAASCLLVLSAFLKARRTDFLQIPKDELKVSIQVDTERMLNVLNNQIRAMDRYLNDFNYLNDQARGNAESADPVTLSRAANLMEALYDWDENERQSIEEAARNLLGKLGLQAVDYAEDTSRLFNTLPSKNTNRTLSPAIVSTQDQRLLRRGTAAVRIDAA